MYRLVLYYLATLVGAALLAGLFGFVSVNPADLALSTILILATSIGTNYIFARIFGAETNVESAYITALILVLIISPVAPTDFAGLSFIIFASVWAMASKYIFAYGNKHLFNPAAFGIAIGALALGSAATWWVSSTQLLLPLVVLGGLLIVRKIHRFDLVIACTLALIAAVAFTTSGNLATTLNITLFRSSFAFLALVMLTEPLTMPPSRTLRIIYGVMVGILFAPNVHFGSFYFTPELALLAGNLFVAFVSPKGRLTLALSDKVELADSTYEFVFTSDRAYRFSPGQYLEWTLGHHFSDNRGNRRFFTVASSPTEKVIRLGVKFYKPASTFKRALWAMQVGDTLSAAHVAGDFTLPRNKKKKLAFIAGGIGITPFRSMTQYVLDTNDARDIVLLYSNKSPSDIAYKDIFDAAEKRISMKTIYTGRIDATLIAQEIPDYRERVFYISGPRGMVEAFTSALRTIGVSRFNIKTDYFPGFA